MVMSPQVSWLFFKARAKRPYLDPYGPSEQRGKTANRPRPGGLRENGPAAALLVGYVPHHFCTGGRKPDRSVKWCGMRPLPPVRLGPPCRRPILNATTSSLYARRCTSHWTGLSSIWTVQTSIFVTVRLIEHRYLWRPILNGHITGASAFHALPRLGS